MGAAGVLLSSASAFDRTVGSVTVTERVVTLPQDAGKWYISVVGDDKEARYREILSWFDTGRLKDLKRQVHFCVVPRGTAMYQERYADNVKGLPTVRMQKSDGTVVYEMAGVKLPASADELNASMASSVTLMREANATCPRRCRPQPQPAPQPDVKPSLDPEPQPLDDGGQPSVEVPAEVPSWGLALLVCGGFMVGIGSGYGRKLYEKVNPSVK